MILFATGSKVVTPKLKKVMGIMSQLKPFSLDYHTRYRTSTSHKRSIVSDNIVLRRVDDTYGRVSATRGGMSHDTLSFSALMGNVQWNRYTKTIQGMGWSRKLLQNNCW